ncbi:MAG TPA: acyl-CoA dehydrogenase family protein, partial [Rhizomicrobium sp.]|nr:acyl-CoA dehydrogenase family protein [Rhizomicrobium sp.]
EAGLAGILTPTEYGGAGGSHGDFAQFIEAVARADASCAVILDVHMSVGTEPLLVFGNDDQKSRYLPRLASGAWLAGFALTEAAGGSDAAAMQTRAVREGDDYVIEGSKAFITGAGDADLYIVMARTADGARGISAFLVEAAWPGVTSGPPLEKMGLRGSLTSELVLDGVHVPAANRLGDEGVGFIVAMSALDSGRVGISAQAVGIAQGALDASVDRARRRRDAGLEVDETALADMEARTAASRQLTRYAAALVDAGQRVTLDAAIAKLYSTDTCVAVAQAAVDLCAPDSAAEDHPAAVRFRDSKACQIYEGTHQLQRVVIARHLLQS